MSVIPILEDRVLYRSVLAPTVLRVADVTAVLAPVLGIQRAALKVWGSWPANEATAYAVADSSQALDLVLITLMLPGQWRSIVEVPNWRSLIGT